MTQSPQPITATAKFAGRSTYIDALRGIAALGVACHHITRNGYGPLQETANVLIPDLIFTLFDRARMGVQIFFVISGFVIAYSLRNVAIHPRFVANYALRRSIRLDPPYWVTIATVLLLHAIFSLVFGWPSILNIPEPLDPPLSGKLVLSHLVYLQNILYPSSANLSVGFWTLCIEVQFYLFYVMALGLVQSVATWTAGTPSSSLQPTSDTSENAKPIVRMHEPWPLLLIAFALPGLISLFYWRDQSNNDMWLTRFYSMFFLGIAAWWALDRRIPTWTFWLYSGAMTFRVTQTIYVEMTDSDEDSFYIPWDLIVACATGVSIYLLGIKGRLATFLDIAPLQFLGRISYSLYLIHFAVLYVVSLLGFWMMSGNPYPVGSLFWLVVALVLSIVVAYGMYIGVERPCVRFAASLKPDESTRNVKQN